MRLLCVIADIRQSVSERKREKGREKEIVNVYKQQNMRCKSKIQVNWFPLFAWNRNRR